MAHWPYIDDTRMETDDGQENQHTIQEVGGKMMIGSSIYGVAVIVGHYDPGFTVCPWICGSVYSRHNNLILHLVSLY